MTDPTSTLIEVPSPYEVVSAFMSDELNVHEAIPARTHSGVPMSPVYWLVRFRDRDNPSVFQPVLVYACTLQEALVDAVHELPLLLQARAMASETDD